LLKFNTFRLSNIAAQVRDLRQWTSNQILEQKDANDLLQGDKLRIYRNDVYKTISDGSGQFKDVIKMSTLW